MYKVDFQKKWVSFILSFLLIFSLAVSIVTQTVLAESASPYEKIITDENGRQITMVIFPVAPPKIKVAAADVPEVHIAGVINSLLNVPAFYWSYGCAATSAAMLFGYYDRTGYSNMYTGSTNGGVCPLDNSVWGTTTYPDVTCGECPLSATHNGTDGRTIRGHVDDYWVDLDNPGPDPWVGYWTEHTPDCTADYMGTNQWKYGSPIDANTDGETIFFWYTDGGSLYDYTGDEPTYRDGCHGMRLFAQSRGYTVLTNFSQKIRGQGSDPNKGFTFTDFQAEIDAGRPVLIQVTDPVIGGHTMLGYGYDTTGSIIYVHDTWDYNNHQMTWGGTYGGMQHRAVTVIRLNPPPPNAPSNLTANVISSSQINLTWQDNSGDETGFKIERKTGSGSYSQIATVGAGVISYSNSGLSANTTYYYRVRAYNAAGNSDYSNEASATTLPLSPPTAPSNLIATPISSSQINLTWQDNSDNESSFEIERKTGSGSYSQIATVGAGVTSYSNTALNASTTYYYRVRAYNAAGNSDYSNEASAKTLPVPPCSCGGTTYNEEWISRVQFNTIDKSSSGNGYADYTSISTTVVRGSTYALKVTIGQTGSWREYVKAYFDWNQDGDFADNGEGIELGYCSSNGCTVSANINIPGGATLGSTRMRIVLQYNSYHGPCGSYTYGDTEDYSVNIQD